jgi:2-dehydro-3-deoxygluconokinase
LASFSLPADIITRLPANDLGEACLQFVHACGVGTEHILRGDDRLGI